MDFTATDSEPEGQLLSLLDVETRSRSSSISLSYPYIRSRERNLSIRAGLTLRDSTTYQLSQASSDDELTILSLGMQFDQADAWGGGGVSLLSATFKQGLDLFGADVTSRADADETFMSLNLQARRNQLINSLWSADIRISAQLSDDSLPSSEQAGLGGENSVRGYEPSEWTGDEVLNAAAEVIYRPEIEWEGQTQFYGFYDIGKVWRDSPQIGEEKTDLARALGFGTRLTFPNNISLNLELARPLDDDSAGNPPDWQLYGRIRGDF